MYDGYLTLVWRTSAITISLGVTSISAHLPMRYVLSFLLLLLINSLVYASAIHRLDSLPKQLEKFSEAYNQEKLYLHTDRKFYAPQESVWIKAYLVNAITHQPSSLSKSIHVELIAPDKSLVSKIVLYSRQGLPSGQITLPDSLINGTYTLKGYTNWMKNAGEEFLFYKEIKVYAGIESEGARLTTQKSTVQVLPEGGHLIEGIESNVAIKTLFDTLWLYGNNRLISEVTSVHNNTALITLKPKPNVMYTLKNKSGESFPFPNILKRGVTMQVNSLLYDKVNITLQKNQLTPPSNNLLVLAHSRGKVVHASTVNLTEKDSTIISIDKRKFQEGISHITIFDKTNRPLAERLIFIQKPKKEVELSTDKFSYTTRDRVSVDIRLIDQFGRPLQGNFSLAAIDVTLVPSPKIESNIASNLLLTSDLKGSIKDPAYYFSFDNPLAKRHLDLLLMTHGWSRFSWRDVLEQKVDSTHMVETGITIAGQVVKAGSGKIIPDGTVIITNVNNNPFNYEKAVFDQNGRFTFRPLLIFDNGLIGFKATNQKNRDITNASFIIEESIDYTPPTYLPAEYKHNFYLDSEMELKAKERLLIEQAYNFDTTARRLDDVIVEGRRAHISQAESAYGAGSVTIEFDKIPTNQKLNRNPLEVIQGKIAGVYMTGMGIGQDNTISIRGASSGLQGGAAPMFFLNDVLLGGGGQNIKGVLKTVMSIPSTDIERIEVFKGPDAAIFGANGATGVIAFYTYAGGSSYNDNNSKEDQFFETLIKNAYQGPREFYAPNYAEELPEHIKPDRRVLLHWAPSITTDKNGRATVEFYTTDNETTIQLDLQGITPNGRPMNITKLIEVEKDKN